MSMNPEKKADNAEKARIMAEAREAKWKTAAGIPLDGATDGEVDDGAVEAQEAEGHFGFELTTTTVGPFTEKLTIRYIDENGNLKVTEWNQVRPSAFQALATRVERVEKGGKKLAQAVKKGVAKSRKWAKGITAMVKETSEALDRTKGYHDNLDSEVNAYGNDLGGIVGFVYDLVEPSLDDINRLDIANTSYLVGSRLVSALGKRMGGQTETGRQLYGLVSAGMRFMAYSTTTGSPLVADEDAVNPTANAGAGLLSWLTGRATAATTPTVPALEVG